jgi:glutathionyl-hydroquinone reductase
MMSMATKPLEELMRTSNDSQNAPMLAINQQLGYQPQAGRYRLMQDLSCPSNQK